MNFQWVLTRLFTYNAILEEATLSKNKFQTTHFQGFSRIFHTIGQVWFRDFQTNPVEKKMPHRKYQTLADSSHKTEILSKTHQISNIPFKHTQKKCHFGKKTFQKVGI